MRPTLRLLILLLAWVGFDPPRDALAQTCATSAITLNYGTVATGSRMSATDVVGSTSVTTSNYTSTVTGTNTNTFSVGPSATLAASGNFLVWQQNNVGVDPSVTPNVSTVTYTFSRAVTNLTITITDIDADNNTNNFIDRLTFDGYATATGGSPITLATSNVVVGTNNTNQFVGSGSTATATSTPVAKNNAVTGIASSAASRASDVTVTFPSPVTRLVLTYENIAPFKTSTTARTQTAGIVNMTWCRLAPTANTITNTSVVNTSGTNAVNSLSGTADGTISYVLGTLPATTQGTLYVNGVAATSGQVLTATQATQLTFAPNPSYTGTYSFTYTTKDDAGNTSTAATYSVPVTAGAVGPCATAGKDGSPTNLSGVVNTYFAGTASVTAGSTSISVAASGGATTGITAGDLLLVIQMQAADINATNDSNYGANNASGAGNLSNSNFTAGTYEYVVAGSTLATGTDGTITVSKLVNSYATAAATATTARKSFQVVRIPQYSSVTLGGQVVALAWNGSIGGIVAMDVAGTLNLNNQTLNAAGLGFRGGAGFKYSGSNTSGLANTDYRTSSALTVNDTKGEGTAGTPRYTLQSLTTAPLRTDNSANTAAFASGVVNGYPNGDNGKGAPGNAGGGGTDDIPTNNGINSGGAGGANGGAGGLGGWPRINTSTNAINTANQAVGGAAFAPASSSRLVMGGGGGAGTSNDGNGDTGKTAIYSSGAPGGGLILIRTGSVSGTGTADASGAGGYLLDASGTGTNDGAGGGGAGGTILITANNTAGLANLTLLANGGAGSSNKNSGDVAHGPGGGGGGGVIFANGTISAASAAAGGVAGTITSSDSYNGTAYGAKPGASGVVNATVSNTIANSTAGANCIADVATTITGPANANAGSTVSLSVTFSNMGAQAAAGVSRTVTLPAGVLNPVASGATITGTVASGYTITYPATSLNSGDTNTYTITYTAPGSGPVVATSNISTTTTEGGLTANNTSSVSTAIGLIADVTTALTGPSTIVAGQPTGTYTASFTNEGPSIASTVNRTVTLPAGATNIIVNGAAYTPTTANTIDFGQAATLASGASNAFTFSFTPATTATGSLAITSNVTTTTSQGNDAAPNSSTITAPVATSADVFATVTANTTSVAAGTLASAGTPPKFTVVFNNNGPATAAGVVAAVQLPKGLTNVAATNGGVYNSTTGIVTYSGLTSIASSTPTTSVITFDAPATGPVVAAATISTTTNEAGQTANNTANAAMTITPAFDLTTTLSGSISAVAGDLVTLAVTTTNNGPSAAPNAVQTVQLVSGLTNVYVSNGGVYNAQTTTQTIVSNGVSYSVPAGGVVFPTLPTVPSGQTVANTVSFVMPNTAFAPTALVTPNTASTATTAGDTNTANNSVGLNGSTSSSPTSIAVNTTAAGTANAYTKITSSVATTTVGSNVTLTVVTGNNGPNQATGVTQTVQFLPGFTTGTLQVNGTTGTPSGNVITFGTNGPTYNTQTGIVTFPTLANGANGSTSGTSVSNTITFVAPASTGSNGQLLATAMVATSNTDPVAADNVSAVAVTLLQSTDLATSITGPASATAGQLVQYTATFTNNGPMAATGVTETAQLPAGLASVTITDAAGNAVSGASYSAATGLVTFPTLATDPNGTTQVFKLTFAAPALSFAPSSSVGSSSSDNVATNNNSSVATAVTASADLATTVTGPATAAVGNAVTYSVNTTNNGPSVATNTVTTLQLAMGFTAATLQVGGQTGTLTGNVITYGSGATASTYDTQTGLVTFPTVANLASGQAVSNYVTFVMSNATGGQTTGVAAASSAATDPIASNNTSSVATSIAPTTTTSADITASVTASAGSVAVGSPVTFTATYGNIGTDPAVNVRPTLQLVPGLTTTTLQVAGQTGTLNGTTITFANGATYSTTTGTVTFPIIASQATGSTGTVSYAVQVTAPANGPLLATAATTSDTSEPATAAARANDVNSASVTITAMFDEVTSISGPASALPGTSQTYTVTTTNNGPSLTSNATTQTVTLPAGLTPTNITNGGVYSGSANTITWTVAANQAPGSNGAVANSFTVVQPAAGLTLLASVTVSGESNTANNSASISTTATNQPPLAYAVVNSQQTPAGATTNNPMGNSAGNNPATPNGLLISPLAASDPENALNGSTPYTITSIPTTTQGVLYYSSDGTSAGTYTAVAAGQTLTANQAKTLRFKPNTSFSGNASFTYLATDAASNQSPIVNYTIPVAADQPTTYVKYNDTKGGANKYVTGDVLAQVTDPNAAIYTAGGLVYNVTTGVLQAGAANGLPTTGTNALLASGTLPAGVSLDPTTGTIYVSDASKLVNNSTAQTYTVSVTTVDINGGTNTAPVSFVIGAYPLPVVLTAFTAQAVQNRDALLNWATASEQNSASFEIERSLDGSTFTKVGQLAAQGTTTTAHTYTFTDASIGTRVQGPIYYRLRQVDLNGDAYYSPVRTVSFSKVASVALSVYPNPATTSTVLDLSALPAAATYQVVVLDATGRQVLAATQAGGLPQPLDLTSLASGTYNVLVTGKLADGSALRQTLRLTKE